MISPSKGLKMDFWRFNHNNGQKIDFWLDGAQEISGKGK